MIRRDAGVADGEAAGGDDRIPRGRASTLVSRVAPVVVSPDAASNRASRYRGMAPLNLYGAAPNTHSTTHTRAAEM